MGKTKRSLQDSKRYQANSKDITLPTKVRLVNAMVFPVVMLWMWELNCKESWAPKDWCFWTVVLEKTLESPLDCKESQPVYHKGDQSWVFIGRTDAEAETPVLWPPHAKSWLIRKDPDAGGRDWRAGGEGDNRGWDGWMASPTWWTWVWVNSGSWWWTGRAGVLWFMGSQRVRHDWATELNWTEPKEKYILKFFSFCRIIFWAVCKQTTYPHKAFLDHHSFDRI